MPHMGRHVEGTLGKVADVSIVKRLCMAHDAITDIGFVFAVISLFLMFLTYCVEVAGRYFLGVTNSWANDMFANFMVISIFSMIPHLTRAGKHISLTLLAETYPRLERPLGIFTALSGALICGLLTYMSFNENARQIARGIMTQQNHPLPMIWWSVFLTYGFCSSTFYFLRSLFTDPAVAVRSWIFPDPVATMAEE
jgi:TRAP-type C4-dicarboxylate transport system permease small subunit